MTFRRLIDMGDPRPKELPAIITSGVWFLGAFHDISLSVQHGEIMTSRSRLLFFRAPEPQQKG